jgi:ATP-binding cassette subfamily B protein
MNLTTENFKNQIEFKNVSFRYSPSSPLVLRNINLTIKRGERVGIVGSTGGGKSTFIDLLMGLLIPTEGKIFIDGSELKNEKLQQWQQQIAHVPQSIYLADGTVKENIALGQREEDIDMARVEASASKAQLTETVALMSKGFNNTVGERGEQLSGGQRQRIGLARALYKDRDIFIFDEATSALDGRTEKLIMNEIDKLDKDYTMFIVAHRVSTLQGCDRILRLEDERSISEVSYDSL